MAISRNKKEAVVGSMSELLANAKLTAFAKYEGLTVAELQELRRAATSAGVSVKVAKNRLVRVALQQSASFKDTDKSALKGQLLYAVSSTDEVAPAQLLAQFAKKHEALKLAGGLTADGSILNEADVKALASLPSKDQLRAQLVGTLAAPISGFVNVLAGNVRGVLNVLNARADAIQ
ncbi:MAG TPA: 50S ribosomal protein L10 [Candidatus Acidoferrum sp.]|nr:50S ribosomal protein L10 [Candidatus Acidoferrum sp.]